MIEISISTANLERALQRMQEAATHLTPLFKDIGEHLVNTTTRRFEDGKAPDGAPWQTNSAITLAGKKDNRPLIGETRLLSTEIHYAASNSMVMIGSNKEYAAMQQFGGKKSQFPHLWGDIPARPFLGVSRDDEEEILALTQDHLKRAIRG